MNKSIIVSIITVILIGFVSFSAKGNIVFLCVGDTSIVMNDTLLLEFNETEKEIQILVPKDETAKKKFISALFAFPFPFGFMGAHRVMLGTKPWVPVVYVATFGGCFGVLPLIDFFVIAFSKDITQYENNPNIFMWLK